MPATAAPDRKPDWLRVRFPAGEGHARLRALMREKDLHTVCEEARCPNIGDCWSRGTATFMILGDVCTRACGFCAVASGRPRALDRGEPRRVALAVRRMGLRHAVVTSVNRDDQPDGGASLFADTVRWIRRLSPGVTVETLIPDFLGDRDALATVLDAAPDILNHNTETVPRLQARVRPRARYERSLELLQRAKDAAPHRLVKSGLMAGLGETPAELLAVFADLRARGVDVLTLGQYLRPTPKHLPVARYYHPDEFADLGEAARAMGFAHVESGPLVRSSYHAEEQASPMLRPSARPGDEPLPVVDQG